MKKFNFRRASIVEICAKILEFGWTFSIEGKDGKYKATVTGENRAGDTMFMDSLESTLFHAATNLCKRLGVQYW